MYREIKAGGASYWTLFDSGSRRTYVTRPVAVRVGLKRLPKPVKTAIAGKVYTIREFCAVGGTIEGYTITADAMVVDRLFPDEQGRPIEIILGMETMETWGINLDNTHKRLDFTWYSHVAYEG